MMTLSAGTRIGVYEVIALLGKGGMGEVYRARDSKLHRDVAIKVLPREFSLDPERTSRFQREAEVLASLNHSAIAAIHGVEESQGIHALVLELVEGQTLAQTIARGPISIDESLSIARQIAEALEAAHAKGILHRDLKPANIKITADGKVKVLDFGLAKVFAIPDSEPDLSNSPTVVPARTQEAVILGTAAYMSPEQARGKVLDVRSDVWSFGCVVFEMLTATSPFDASTVSDTISRILKDQPDWSLLPQDVPIEIRALLRACLQKDANRRIRDFHDVGVQFEEAMAPGAAVQHRPVVRMPAWHWILSASMGFLMIGAAIGWFGRGAAPLTPTVTHLQMSLQPADHLSTSIVSVRPSRTAFALSPDGRRIVFSAIRGTDAPQLYSRELAESEAKPIPGTEGGIGPFFSPDGQWVGFFAQNQIKKVSIGGGPPVVICDVTTGFDGSFGASWAEDGTIFFSDLGAGISKVPSGGGIPAPVTLGDEVKGERHLLPHILPGGKALIFTAQNSYQSESAQVVIQSLETGQRRVLIHGGADARFVRTGHIVYMKTGTLMAVPFDSEKLEVTGDPVALTESVMQAVNMPNLRDETGSGQFVISASGTLVYANGGVHPPLESSLKWVDRNGATQPTSLPVKNFLSPRISPNGDRVAWIERSPLSMSVWVYDAVRAIPSRLASAKGLWPVIWSPNGTRLVFSSDQSGRMNLYIVNADASGQIERLTNSEHYQFPSSWSAQANSIAFVEYRPPNYQIWVLPMEGNRSPTRFLESQSKLSYPEFSPDGRWIAYQSDETSPPAVYVQPYPGPGGKHRISAEGGREMQPVWPANGREILYRAGAKFYSVAITSLEPFRAESPRLLFESKPNEYSDTELVRGWDVNRDGQRFLLSRTEESKDKPVTQLQIVLNWTEELKRRVGAK